MNSEVKLIFHGAAKTVTGSCFEFIFGGKRILVDCGLFQGSRSLERLNYEDFSFNPQSIDAVILTHAHIDHSGLLPKLIAKGFDGKIWCTKQTADLLEFMLADAGRIQEFEAQRRNKRKDRAGETPFEPLYTEANAIETWQRAYPIDLGQWFDPINGIKARFWNAGHILGAVSVEIEIAGLKILCSGDIGPDNKAFQIDPSGNNKEEYRFDYILCEATYGDRLRNDESIQIRRQNLGKEIGYALKRGGNLIIPAFALERTQELLLDIIMLMRGGEIAEAQIFVDSPLATQATSVFSKYSNELQDIEGKNIFEDPHIHYVEDVELSKKLNSVRGAIIIAASGMCEAGRIRHHLLSNLPRAQSTILFVGFQAIGSLGRTIIDGAKKVRINGQDVSIRAKIIEIEGYSAHADQSELLAWLSARGKPKGSIFLIHGENIGIDTLETHLLEGDKTASIIKPEISEEYELYSAAPAKRLKTGRKNLENIIGTDWQNAGTDFSINLKQNLAKIDSHSDRIKAIQEMKGILAKYAGKF